MAIPGLSTYWCENIWIPQRYTVPVVSATSFVALANNSTTTHSMRCQFQLYSFFTGLEIVVDSYKLDQYYGQITIIDQSSGAQVAKLAGSSSGPLTYHTSKNTSINIDSSNPHGFRILVR